VHHSVDQTIRAGRGEDVGGEGVVSEGGEGGSAKEGSAGGRGSTFFDALLAKGKEGEMRGLQQTKIE
jgi:hypothetical protein